MPSYRSRCALLVALTLSACSHVSTVRLHQDSVDVGENLRPIAGIQANASSFYLLFIPIPGVDLDKVVNQMLIATAKSMGADKVTNLQFDVTPDGGWWALRKLLFYRSARASGIAVQVTGPAPDPSADQGPEAGGSPEQPAQTAPPTPSTADSPTPPPTGTTPQ